MNHDTHEQLEMLIAGRMRMAWQHGLPQLLLVFRDEDHFFLGGSSILGAGTAGQTVGTALMSVPQEIGAGRRPPFVVPPSFFGVALLTWLGSIHVSGSEPSGREMEMVSVVNSRMDDESFLVGVAATSTLSPREAEELIDPAALGALEIVLQTVMQRSN